MQYENMKNEMCVRMKGLSMSPCGMIGKKKNDKRSPLGVSCCSDCKFCILKDQTPLFAIVNENNVGNPPDVLLELSPIELALITPVKNLWLLFFCILVGKYEFKRYYDTYESFREKHSSWYSTITRYGYRECYSNIY